MFNIERYGQRVSLGKAPAVNEDGLRGLHRAQMFAIPFENLDIQLGRNIHLDATSLAAKLVDQGRGGYCFELNGLLLLALEAYGFECRPLLARVHLHDTPTGRTHQLCLITFGSHHWIADCGFGGGGPRGPMALEVGTHEVEPGYTLRLSQHDRWGWMLHTLDRGEWKDSYSFDLSWVAPADIEVGNHYTSTSSASHFTTSRVVSQATRDGRKSLANYELTTLTAAGESKRTLSTGPGYLQELRREFGIDLDASYDQLRPVAIP